MNEPAVLSSPSSPPSPALDVPTAPWSSPPKDVLDALHASPEGLAPDEADRRRAVYGPNVLQEVEAASLWALLANQVASLVVGLLFAAAAVSLAFGDTIEAVAIGIVLLVNTGIGFFTEWRAVRSMEALREIGHVPAVVLRGGRPARVDAESLVPGDVVVLDEGDVVTADLRLIEASKLQVDESPLTGESVPVEKQVDPVDAEAALADRPSMAYKGTSVTCGTGRGVVVATGMETELGAISSLVEEAEKGETPLEERLDGLARSLVVVVLVLAAAVTAAGLYAGRELQLMVETGIALAVAAIPEGLPVVATLALARGLRRMARRNALVRRLSSVETLGATGVVCTDKTGTLTENRMRVARLVLPGPDGGPATDIDLEDGPPGNGSFERGSGPDPSREPGAVAAPGAPLLRTAAAVAALCNAATLEPAGDPMEVALLHFARRAGLPPADLEARYPEETRDAFDRETKKMASLRRRNGGAFVAVKGAPEEVLQTAAFEATPRDGDDAPVALGEGRPLPEERRRAWRERNEALAADGLRVLGLAARESREAAGAAPDDLYADLHLVGLVGLVDPPREDVRPSIEACQNAGITVVMVTGDQPETARFIARAVGLAGEDDAIVHGRDFDRLLETPDGRTRLSEASILARVAPKQKLDLIDLHQEAGRIVAMTGDGVNDAPALKSADIGIAMGQRGTQVAQEAADMVLTDDAFSTIVAAVEEGRAIFANIRAFVRYLLSCNVGEVMVVGLAALVGLPLPILPLQILFLNLVTDVFPALALGAAEAEADVMTHAPRDADEPVLTRSDWGLIAFFGGVFTVSVLGAMLASRSLLGASPDEAVTVSFLTLAFGQLWHVFNMRSPSASLVGNVVVRTPYVWGALGLCTALLLAAVYVPAVAEVMSLAAPTPAGWALVLAASLVPLAAGQLALAVRARL